VKKVAQESNEPSSDDVGPHDVKAASHGPLHTIGTCFVLIPTTRSVVVRQSFPIHAEQQTVTDLQQIIGIVSKDGALQGPANHTF